MSLSRHRPAIVFQPVIRSRNRGVRLAALLLVLFAFSPAPASASPPAAPVSPVAGVASFPGAAQGGSDAWAWPVPAASRRALRDFEAPASPYSAGHRGMDVAARPGDPVYAVADGVVAFAGTVVDRPALSIGHPGELVSSLEPVAASVSVGERVRRGQLVGRVATGGHCSAVCVHLGARLHGGYVSPLRYLGGIPRAVLLPVDAARAVAEVSDRVRPERERLLWRALR